MIEVVYKDEKQEADENQEIFHIPRNVRQIGIPTDIYRIYMEDYVFTFLSGMSKEAEEKGKDSGCLAILMGETKWKDGTAFLFISGALSVVMEELCAEHISFTEENWQNIQKEKEQYFPEKEVVGWFFGNAQWGAETAQLFTKVHLKYFGGDKVLMLMDSAEGEDGFFRLENGCLIRQKGYYIYYEKNPQMQSYMVDKRQKSGAEAQEKTEDEAVKKFRKIIKGKEKEKPQETEEKPSVFSYAATACLALAVLAVGINFYRDYDRTAAVSIEETALVSDDEEEKSIVETDKKKTEEENNTGTADMSKTDINEADTDAGEANRESSPEQSESMSGGENSGTEVDTTSAESDAQARRQQIYQEESDIRKAQRREALENMQAEETETQANVQTDSQTDSQTDTRIADTGNASENTSETETSASVRRETYVIRPGDTLYQISMEKYGSVDAIEEICRLNSISQEEIIYPGQVIVLP